MIKHPIIAVMFYMI